MNILMSIMTILVMGLSQNEVENLASSYKEIDNAECLYYSDTVIIALKTEPIFFRSDRIKLADSLREEIRVKYDVRDIIISFDKDIYYKITKIDLMRSKGISEDIIRPDIIELIETAKYREN